MISRVHPVVLRRAFHSSIAAFNSPYRLIDESNSKNVESASNPSGPNTQLEVIKQSSSSPITSTSSSGLPQLPPAHDLQHVPRVNAFDTHRFVKILEQSFPTPIAHTLMRASRAILVVRFGRVKQEVFGVRDLDNQAYLFRAALSELRAELTMRTRSEFAALRTASTALRRDVDALNGKLKEDIATLKHDRKYIACGTRTSIEMEINDRKNETRADAKASEIAIEVVLLRGHRLMVAQELNHRATIKISDLRTEIEQAKWVNISRGVLGVLGLVSLVIVGMELAPKPPKPVPVPTPTVVVEREKPDLRYFEDSE
ncbi:hypothetical protein FRC10_003703 [Ceratobasidium sp. 414]|nr:hypothetical protein FRC10_003703 [Ceratobasidium sp. 414]